MTRHEFGVTRQRNRPDEFDASGEKIAPMTVIVRDILEDYPVPVVQPSAEEQHNREVADMLQLNQSDGSPLSKPGLGGEPVKDIELTRDNYDAYMKQQTDKTTRIHNMLNGPGAVGKMS